MHRSSEWNVLHPWWPSHPSKRRPPQANEDHLQGHWAHLCDVGRCEVAVGLGATMVIAVGRDHHLQGIAHDHHLRVPKAEGAEENRAFS